MTDYSAMMEKVLRNNPNLFFGGLGVKDDTQDLFRTAQGLKAFEYSYKWLATKPRTKKLWYNSYSLKHRIESDYQQEVPHSPGYISNGTAICAVIALGWPYAREFYNSPNISIGISKRSVNFDDRTCRACGRIYELCTCVAVDGPWVIEKDGKLTYMGNDSDRLVDPRGNPIRRWDRARR